MGVPVNTILLEPIQFSRKTANYTLALADWGMCIEMNVASANTWTVPPNSSVAFPVGAMIQGSCYGAGQTTITPGSGVVIRSRGGALKSAGQYAMWQVVKVATDEWYASGDLAV